MLVLTRKLGKTLVINSNIKITIQEINGDQVKLSIDAPKEIPVDREEIHLRKLKDAEKKAKNSDDTTD